MYKRIKNLQYCGTSIFLPLYEYSHFAIAARLLNNIISLKWKANIHHCEYFESKIILHFIYPTNVITNNRSFDSVEFQFSQHFLCFRLRSSDLMGFFANFRLCFSFRLIISTEKIRFSATNLLLFACFFMSPSERKE